MTSLSSSLWLQLLLLIVTKLSLLVESHATDINESVTELSLTSDTRHL